jgi:hypothetical protein
MEPRDLIPALVVVLCAWVGATLPNSDRCEPSDGPQFACWLEQQ